MAVYETRDDLAEDLLGVWRHVRRVAYPVYRGDLTPEQFWLLRHLHAAGPVSVGDLASALGVTQSAVTTACQRLERAGLATRSRDQDDERVVRVELTESGRTRLAEWRERKQAAVSPLLATLSPEETSELQRLLRKILAASDRGPVVPAMFWSIASVAESLI